MDDLPVVDDVVEDLELGDFDEGTMMTATHREYDGRIMVAAQDAKERISQVTVNEFVLEAYRAATMIRNILGDADALAAESAETIRRNLLVVMTEIDKDPVGFLMSVIMADKDWQRRIRRCEEASKLLAQAAQELGDAGELWDD
jgi:hypothetical protein